MILREHLTKDIHDEHCRLRDLLESVRRMLAARCASRSTVITMLNELVEYVLGHFEHEEKGGYFSEAINKAPRLSERANTLLDEHPQLAKQLDALRKSVDVKDMSESWWLELEQRFSKFIARFQRHETAENALLFEAYNDDIGTED